MIGLSSLPSLLRSERGAISSMYAIAILPLIVMAGVAFDYGRMMGLDTELQNAADQAALAAATQLDGSSDAITNSQIAAANALGNQTRFANDGAGRSIPTSGLTFTYYEGYENDAPVNETTVPEDAKVVEVTVENRAVRYALTPVMAAFSGGVARGKAMATLQDATCNVPPLMFCTPNNAFPGEDDLGKGIPLHMKKNQAGNGNGTPQAENPLWAPGDFGFLDIPYPGLSGSNKNRTLGLNSDGAGCFADGVESRTGFRTPETVALNTRLDIYDPPLNGNNSCDSNNGDFCPSANVTKNYVYVQSFSNKSDAQIAALTCTSTPSGALTAVKDIPATENPPSSPGYPCDSAGCTSFGSGDWNPQSWFSTNHPGADFSTVSDLDGNGSISRYEVYRWELDNDALNPREAGRYVGPAGKNGKKDGKLYCSYPRPIRTPFAGQTKDRRLLTVAAVDCTGLNGHAPVNIKRWVDIFLVTSADRTTGTDDLLEGRSFYGEIKGPATIDGNQNAFQYFSRRKAVLLR